MPEMFGPYRLDELRGRGGMGEVWRARDTRKDRDVAVKILGAWLDPADTGFARRFRRESALAARLNAPNIVPIHDYGEIDGRLYIEMPVVTGEDLGTVLARPDPLPPDRAVGIVEQVGRALSVAHRSGLLHRDVKPSNILVVETVDDDHVYLIDFGIVRDLTDVGGSESGGAIGTPAYMAPERFDGRDDYRGDVYALGCVLHEALTGSPPYVAAGPVAMMNCHLHEPPPRPSAVRPNLPPGLDAVVARAMAKDPAQRHGSAAELTADARAALDRPDESRADGTTAAAPPIVGRGPHRTLPSDGPPRTPTEPGSVPRHAAWWGTVLGVTTVVLAVGASAALLVDPTDGPDTPPPTPAAVAPTPAPVLPPTTDPVVWAGRLCTALEPYARAGAQPQPDPAGMDPTGVQRVVSSYLGTFAGGVRDSQRRLRAIGPSPLPGGNQLARSFGDLLTRVGSTVDDARDDIDSSNPRDLAEFRRSLAIAETKLRTLESLDGLYRLDRTAELDRADSAAPECRRLDTILPP